MSLLNLLRTRSFPAHLFFAAVLALFMWPSVPAQDSAAPIRIVVVSGQDAEHRTGQDCARLLLVRIEEESGQPIDQAELLFVLPQTGPGGAFADGATSAKGRTNAMGLAAVPPFKLNRTSGAFEIQAEATWKGQRATAAIHQTSRGRRGVGKKIAIISAVAAGGVGAAVALSKRKGDPPICNPAP